MDNIEKLLEKYLNAETDLQEEALLKNYFTGNKVAPHLQEYQSMFQYFTESKSERHTKDIRLKSNPQKRKWISMAASLALLISVFSYVKYQQHIKTQQAYADTQYALQLIGVHMNKSNDAIAHLNKFDQTTSKIFKNE
ncbi:MAG: hypothetical protein ABFS32_15375 [Bacteroidota bacterium]